LNEYINAVIYEYNDITDDEAETTLEAQTPGLGKTAASSSLPPGWNTGLWLPYGNLSDMQIQRWPLLQTQWGQGTTGAYIDTGFAYNNYIKHHYRNDPNGRWFVTGCGPTAVAQIIAYHNFINPNAASRARMAPPFTFTTSSTMNMGIWNGQYNLSLIRTMPFIRNFHSADAKGQVAALMFHMFREVKATPEPFLTTSNTNTKAPAFKNLGYSIVHEGVATTVSGTIDNFSIQYLTGLNVIRDAINNNRPILAFGLSATGGKKGGHYWVIDGYGSVTWITEYYRHGTTREIFTRTIFLNNVLMVHCNMGWDDKNSGYNYNGYTGWYIYGIFDAAANRLHQHHDINGGNQNYSANTWLVIPRRP
jgi:hypothetical protein